MIQKTNIVLARKPLSEKSVAENVLKWGTGGLNIDGSRIPFVDEKDTWNNQVAQDIRGNTFIGANKGNLDLIKNHNPQGRFPANIIFDEEAGEVLDKQSGVSKSNTKPKVVEDKDANIFNDGTKKTTGHNKKIYVGDYSDKGGASRFFKQIKKD